MSPVRWLRAVLVVGMTALLFSCTWQLGAPIPEGVPPPAGDPVPPVSIHTSGRGADQLYAWAAERAGALGIPVTALEAYGYAARVADVTHPDCQLSWTTLAGIGQVESHHGTYRGATLAPNGDVRPPIRGLRLDGTGGTKRIIDHDVESADGQPEYARAMGPMQFIPETWGYFGVDANGDGVADPDNIDDAALAAAGDLCFTTRVSGHSLATPRGWIAALYAYNQSDEYARAVRDWATAYAAGHPL